MKITGGRTYKVELGHSTVLREDRVSSLQKANFGIVLYNFSNTLISTIERINRSYLFARNLYLNEPKLSFLYVEVSLPVHLSAQFVGHLGLDPS